MSEPAQMTTAQVAGQFYRDLREEGLPHDIVAACVIAAVQVEVGPGGGVILAPPQGLDPALVAAVGVEQAARMTARMEAGQ